MIFGAWKKKSHKTCCFTGHRPQGLPFGFDESQPSCLRLKEVLRQEIERQITENGVSHFISGMALGVDLICAELVLELKAKYPRITLEGAIPCEKQAARWGTAQQEQYCSLLSRCDKKTVIQKAYTKDCFQKRNYYMVDSSEYVIAVWNGNPSGTGQTVLYARQQEKAVVVINPNTLEIARSTSE